jgi:bla regulator protein BlaR1
MMKRVSIVSSAILLTYGILPFPLTAVGQASVSHFQAVAAPSDASKDAAKPLAFEVVSVRPGKMGDQSGHGVTTDGLNLSGVTPLALLIFAYQFREVPRILRLPDWCKTEFYSVDAKVSESDLGRWSDASLLKPNPALQALLQDRFHLEVHRETRESPVYDLVVGENGPRFAGTHPAAGTDSPSRLLAMSNVLTGHQVTMASLASFLGSVIGRPVVDKTMLKDKYDFSFPFVKDELNAPDGNTVPSVFTAIRDNLGLKLEPAKAPIEYLVIDHIDRPTAN